MHILLLPSDGVNEVTVISSDMAVIRFTVEELPDQRRSFPAYKAARDAFKGKMAELLNSLPERWLLNLGAKEVVTFTVFPPVHAGDLLEVIDEAIREIRSEEPWQYCFHAVSVRKVTMP